MPEEVVLPESGETAAESEIQVKDEVHTEEKVERAVVEEKKGRNKKREIRLLPTDLRFD